MVKKVCVLGGEQERVRGQRSGTRGLVWGRQLQFAELEASLVGLKGGVWKDWAGACPTYSWGSCCLVPASWAVTECVDLGCQMWVFKRIRHVDLFVCSVPNFVILTSYSPWFECCSREHWRLKRTCLQDWFALWATDLPPGLWSNVRKTVFELRPLLLFKKKKSPKWAGDSLSLNCFVSLKFCFVFINLSRRKASVLTNVIRYIFLNIYLDSTWN